MKKLVPLLLIALLLIVACDRQKQEAINLEAEKIKIENALEQYALANENKDFSIIEKIWAEEDDILMIGTDSDEKLIGWDQIKNAIQKQFESIDSTYISINEQLIKINESANTAWFSEILSYNYMYKGQAMSFEGIRFTGVLRKTDGNWELVQGHLSIPAEVDLEE